MNATSPRPKKLLFVCGSHNQTTQMHAIARELPEHRAVFTPYYGDASFDLARALGLLEPTIGGRKLGRRTLDYLRAHDLGYESGGALDDFDLAVTCSDLVVPKNLTRRPLVLVQEGMTDPPTMLLPWLKRLPSLPRWLGGTAALGLSHRYARFCVASEGYREHFVTLGCDPSRLVVTGIPNFDDCERYRKTTFPFRGFVLCCTSDTREVFGFEDRRATIRRAVAIARERAKPLVFKLHPNEDARRATREIERHAPHALVYSRGSAEEMVACCDTLVCSYSSLAYVGLALGKEVFSRFDLAELRRRLPIQNRAAAANIAAVVRELLATEPTSAKASGRRAAMSEPMARGSEP
jgi:hypothetical protein